MVKSQQQVSANQGRLDAFMTQSQPTTAAPAVASSATAGPTASTSAPAAPPAAPQAGTAMVPPATAATTAGSVSGRPSWVKPVSDQRSSRGNAAPVNAARPRDITNLPLAAVSSPAKGQTRHSMPNAVSPGKQTRMQTFFQPKHVVQGQQQLSQQQQQHLSHQQQPAGHRSVQASAAASGDRMHSQGAAQHAPHQHALPQQWPQQLSQSCHQLPQQQQQQQQHAMPSYKPVVKVSGVFADDDDFDDIWMSDQAFQAPVAQPAAGSSIQAMPVIDLASSPAHKKPRT